jgi:hypothetical protein
MRPRASKPSHRRAEDCPREPRRLSLVKLSLLVLLFVAGPTAGDIGSCGQEVAELDPVKFFSEKQAIDCRQCQECEWSTLACEQACGTVLIESSFPADCFPLVHDGEVCLNALRAADCDEYAAYVDDLAPTVPTECNFCPPDQQPEAP